MLKICFTYDYELFMGKNNATAEEILFAPTQKIKEAMDEFGVKGVFFVDVCSAIAHERYNLIEFNAGFDEQIKGLVTDGHDVQLHIHSSWLKAHKNGDKLEINQDGYRIHEFGFDEKKEESAQKIIKESIEYLDRTCKEVCQDYKCIAYRAGGFCVQPEHELLKILMDNGILIDSSVVPRYYFLEGVNASDFRKVPRKLNWYISPEKGIGYADKKGVYEVPIASVKMRLFERLMTRRTARRLPSVKLKGEYVKSDGFIPKVKSKKWKRFAALFKYHFLSLDSGHYKMLMNDLEFIYKKYRLHRDDAYICLLCHPKLADDARVENIKKLISELLKQPDKYAIVTMRDIYESLKLN